MKRSRPTRGKTHGAQEKREDRKQKVEEADHEDDETAKIAAKSEEGEDGEDSTEDRREGVLDHVKTGGPQQTDDEEDDYETTSRCSPSRHGRKVSEGSPGASSSKSRSRGGSDEDGSTTLALRSHKKREDDKNGPNASDGHVNVEMPCKPVKRKLDESDAKYERLAGKTRQKQIPFAQSQGVADKTPRKQVHFARSEEVASKSVQNKLSFDAEDKHTADYKPYLQDTKGKRTADRRMSSNRSCKQDKLACDVRCEDAAENSRQHASEGEEDDQGSREDSGENRKDSEDDEDEGKDADDPVRKGDGEEDSEGGSDEQEQSEEEQAGDQMREDDDEGGSEGGSDEQEQSEEEQAGDQMREDNDEGGSEGGSDEQEQSEEEQAGDKEASEEQDSEGSPKRSEEEEDLSMQEDDDADGDDEEPREGHQAEPGVDEESEEDSSVEGGSSEKDDHRKDDASITSCFETAKQYIRLIHKYDEGVLQLLVETAQLCPSMEIDCCGLFAEYHMREADPHRISDPSPYELWHRAVRASTQQAARTANAVLSRLRQLAEDVQVRCARKYVQGILNHKDSPMAVCALLTLGQEIPHKRDKFEAMCNLLPVRMNQNQGRILMPADMPPIEALRKLYEKNECYEAVKRKFERTHVYTAHEDEFWVLADNSNVGPNQPFKMPNKIANQKSLSKRWNHWRYNDLNGDNEIVSQPFFVKWEQDPTRQMYDTTCVDPECKRADRVYNLYPRALASRVSPISEADAEQFSRPFFDHLLHVTANGSEQNFHFLKNQLAKLVQEPWEKSNHMICLHGSDVTLEENLFKFFGKYVLGNACFIQTSDVENGLMAKCPDIMRGKLLVLLEDIIDLSRKSERRLKDLITGSDIPCPNKQGSNIAHIENRANFISLTNQPPRFKFSGMESCVVALKVSDALRGDTSYHNELAKSLTHPKAGVAVYQMLRDFDITSLEFSPLSRGPVTTESLEAQILKAVKTFGDFMSVVANADIAKVENKELKFKVRSRALYDCSKECCSLEYKGKPMPFKEFGSQLQELLRAYKCPNTSNTSYVVSQAQICEELKKRGKYNEEARLPQGEVLQLQVKPGQ